MKYLAVAATLFLAGCATVVPEDITSRAKQIQALTTTICKFVPTIGTIASILSSGTAAPFAAIAADICLAVTTAPLADGPRHLRARVNGVEIRGKFVR